MYFPLIHALGDFLARTPSEQTERGRAGIGVGEGEENDPPIPTTVLPDMSYFEQLWGSMLAQAASTSLSLIAHAVGFTAGAGCLKITVSHCTFFPSIPTYTAYMPTKSSALSLVESTQLIKKDSMTLLSIYMKF